MEDFRLPHTITQEMGDESLFLEPSGENWRVGNPRYARVTGLVSILIQTMTTESLGNYYQANSSSRSVLKGQIYPRINQCPYTPMEHLQNVRTSWLDGLLKAIFTLCITTGNSYHFQKLDSKHGKLYHTVILSAGD